MKKTVDKKKMENSLCLDYVTEKYYNYVTTRRICEINQLHFLLIDFLA